MAPKRAGINWPANCRLANRCSSEYNVLKSTSFWGCFAGEHVAAKMDLRERGTFERVYSIGPLAPAATNRRFVLL